MFKYYSITMSKVQQNLSLSTTLSQEIEQPSKLWLVEGGYLMPGAIIPITIVYSAVDQLHQSQLAWESLWLLLFLKCKGLRGTACNHVNMNTNIRIVTWHLMCSSLSFTIHLMTEFVLFQWNILSQEQLLHVHLQVHLFCIGNRAGLQITFEKWQQCQGQELTGSLIHEHVWQNPKDRQLLWRFQSNLLLDVMTRYL